MSFCEPIPRNIWVRGSSKEGMSRLAYSTTIKNNAPAAIEMHPLFGNRRRTPNKTALKRVSPVVWFNISLCRSVPKDKNGKNTTDCNVHNESPSGPVSYSTNSISLRKLYVI